MTTEQVRTILTDICDQYDGNSEADRPNIEIMHGQQNYTPFAADFAAWNVSDGILRVAWNGGTRWIDCESIHCIGI